MITHEILHPKGKSTYQFDFIKDIIDLPCFSIVNRNDDLNCLENPILKQWMQFDNFIILGTGGSSLGAQCIQSIAEISPDYNKKIKFVDNLDPDSLCKILSGINLKNTGFLCISKSGETLETLVQLNLVINLLSTEVSYNSNQELTDFIKKRFVIITENKISSLKSIAAKYDFLCLDHPQAIGGRFSVFSIVGALPALLCGVDPFLIRKGGQYILNGSIANIKNGASFLVQNIKNNILQHVLFIYSDKLLPFGRWLAQLYAESTGKSGNGITPITARGSVDQHSQLQLYMDGPNNKCFSFLVENFDCDMTVDVTHFPEQLQFLNQKTISDIFKSQCNATITALTEKNYNIRKIVLPKITPEILGMLFMHFMMETVCVCRLLNVNPFDQHAVERGKIITKQLLTH